MNNDVLWTLVVIATIVYEVIVIYMYLRDFLEPKPYNKILKTSAFIVFFIVGVLMNLFIRTPAITLLYDVIGVFSLSFLFGGDIKIKVFATILLIAFLIASEIITLFSIMTLGGVDANSVLDQASLRLLGVIISKTTLLIITKVTCVLKKKNYSKIPIFYWIALLLISAISILTIHDITMINMKLGDTKLTIMSLVIVIGLFYTNILVFYLFESIIEKTEIQTNNKLLEQQIEYQLNHYKDLEISQNQIRTLKHDIKNHIICITDLVENKDYDKTLQYLNTLSNTVNYNKEITTGNPVIDSLLNAKSTIAKSDQIKIIYTIDLPPNIKIESVDSCVIFGNALDNAIEACRRINNNENKEIKIILRYYDFNKSLLCEIYNTTNGILKRHGEYYATSKKDTQQHGLGLKNINTSIKKYNGTLNFEHKNNIFKLSFILYNV